METKTATRVLEILEKEVETYRVPVMDLQETHGGEPFRILVGTILSARTKDETTAAACRRLFAQARTPTQLAKLSERELRELIYPVGFYKTKARALKKLPAALEEFGGRVPRTIDELVTLPGVGRKTANLVVSIAYEEDGVCVDTHVHRIMNRLGYVRTTTPLETEKRLRQKLPRKWWKWVNRTLVPFGQFTCTPQSPWCSRCPVKEYCERRGVKKSR